MTESIENKPQLEEPTEEVEVPKEEPKVKQKVSEKQLENLAKARAARAANLKKNATARKERVLEEHKEFLRKEMENLVAARLQEEKEAQRGAEETEEAPKRKELAKRPKPKPQPLENKKKPTPPPVSSDDDNDDDASTDFKSHNVTAPSMYDPFARISH